MSAEVPGFATGESRSAPARDSDAVASYFLAQNWVPIYLTDQA